MGWLSPTSDIANGWTSSSLAWDDNTATFALHSTPAGWGPYLELHHAELQCTKVQGWWGIANTQVTDVEVDVYYSGVYNNIYSGAIVIGSFQEYEIGSEQAVTAMRVRFAASKAAREAYVYEVDFWEVEGGVTVTPDLIALVITTFIPTVTTTANLSVTPDVVALSITTFIPTVSVTDNQVVTPDSLALTLTTHIPDVTATVNQVVTPDIVALAIITYIPTVSLGGNVEVTPDTLALVTSLFVPTVSVTDNQTVTPDALAHTITTYIPTISITDNQVVTPDAIGLTISTFIPTVSIGGSVSVTPDTLALLLTTYIPTVTTTSGFTSAYLKIWTGSEWVSVT